MLTSSRGTSPLVHVVEARIKLLFLARKMSETATNFARYGSTIFQRSYVLNVFNCIAAKIASLDFTANLQ